MMLAAAALATAALAVPSPHSLAAVNSSSAVILNNGLTFPLASFGLSMASLGLPLASLWPPLIFDWLPLAPLGQAFAPLGVPLVLPWSSPFPLRRS